MQRADWHGDSGVEEARNSRAAYLANVEFVDEGIGQVLEWLEKSDLMDDFVVVWVSDHGDMNGDHNLWRKGYPWQESLHIPFVMKLPKQAANALQACNGNPERRAAELLLSSPSTHTPPPSIQNRNSLDVLKAHAKARRKIRQSKV